MMTAKRILVRGVNWLGDAVMTTPALMRLRERFPDACITMLAPGKIADLWLHHAAVDERMAFSSGEGLFSVAGRVRAGGFDLALVLPNSPRSALEVWLGGVPRRVGYARPWRNLFLTQAVPARPSAVRMRKRSIQEIRKLVNAGDTVPRPATQALGIGHQTHDYLHLVAALGARSDPTPPCLEVTAEETDAAAAKFGLRTGAVGGAPLFALNAGAEYGPAKRWPAERFSAAAVSIQKATGCTWLVVGGAGDRPVAESIAAALQNQCGATVNLAGRTTLRELMAVLKLSRALLSNDTGPMHVAAALGTPVVVPFGSTSPELTGPGLIGQGPHQFLRSSAPCAPCFLRECPIDFRCMTGITVESVVKAVLTFA